MTTTINFKPTNKQFEAWGYLNDKTTTEILYGGAAGSGKAQPLDALISTPFGFRKMGDMKVGQLIHHPQGSLTRIIAIHPQGEKEIVKVTFDDLSSTECCLDHLWEIQISRNRQTKFNKKSGIESTIYTTLQLEELLSKGKTIYIPMTDPVQFTSGKPNKYILHPYILGILIGDGGLTSNITFTSADIEIVNRVKELLPSEYKVNKHGKYGYSIVYKHRTKEGYYMNPIRDELKKMGLLCKSESKFIPKYYFKASLSDRWELIKGLMDSDGYIDKGGNVSFSSSSKQLSIDVREILLSLGFKVKLTSNKAGYKKDGLYIQCLDSHDLYIQGRNKEELFFLKRKKDRVIYFKYKNERKIISIERIGKKEAQCITVSARDGLYLTNDYIVTHNSMIGCAWLIISCLQYGGSRYLMGRSKLSTLKTTTLKTFNDLCKEWDILDKIKINQHTNTILFDNGSEILMKDLFYYPSDPEYDNLGSLEITGCFIDEVSQVSYKAFEIIQTRIRYKLKEFNLVPKLFMSCNPSKGFLYTEFYKPFLDNNLKPYRKFIPALASDNPYIDPNYITQLKKSTQVVQQRLLYGNWNYSDDVDSLFKYSDLLKIREVSNYNPSPSKYITADIARLGKDSTIIIIWDGLTIIDIIELNGVTTDISTAKIISLSKIHNISPQNIIIDGDGIGGGVVDQMKGVKSFINGSRQIEIRGEPPIYQNLKSQCYYKLAEYVEKGKIKCISISEENFEDLAQELQVIKQKDIDGDGKLSIIPKDQMKKILGRSPDLADAVMFRMWFELNSIPNRTPFRI